MGLLVSREEDPAGDVHDTEAAVSSTGTPLPRHHHKIVPRIPGRVFFIGDVHGCADELHELMFMKSFDRSKGDTLVFVGDLVNKGPKSGEVVRVARANDAWCVRGNHEDELLEAWYRCGRFAESLDNYKHDAKDQVSLADVEWIRELPLTLQLPWLSVIVAHAGLIPGIDVEKQSFKTLLWLRDLVSAEDGGWRGQEWETDDSVPWAPNATGPEHIVFGHDARRKLQTEKFATGLDTGCCYGNQLTAIVVSAGDWEQRELVQVQAKRVYEQPKHGSTKPASSS